MPVATGDEAIAEVYQFTRLGAVADKTTTLPAQTVVSATTGAAGCGRWEMVICAVAVQPLASVWPQKYPVSLRVLLK